MQNAKWASVGEMMVWQAYWPVIKKTTTMAASMFSNPHISYWKPTCTHEDLNGAEKVPQFYDGRGFSIFLLLNARGEIKFDEPLEVDPNHVTLVVMSLSK